MAAKTDAVATEEPTDETPTETEEATEAPVAPEPEAPADAVATVSSKVATDEGGQGYYALETFVGVYQHHTLRYTAGEIIPERIGKYFYETGAPVTIG